MQAKLHDVIVIGSGAGGGTLSARLANLGADVLVLEGGPKINNGIGWGNWHISDTNA